MNNTPVNSVIAACMSLGLMVQYGPFRFYTAGDFFDVFRLPDGTKRVLELIEEIQKK